MNRRKAKKRYGCKLQHHYMLEGIRCCFHEMRAQIAKRFDTVFSAYGKLGGQVGKHYFSE